MERAPGQMTKQKHLHKSFVSFGQNNPKSASFFETVTVNEAGAAIKQVFTSALHSIWFRPKDQSHTLLHFSAVFVLFIRLLYAHFHTCAETDLANKGWELETTWLERHSDDRSPLQRNRSESVGSNGGTGGRTHKVHVDEWLFSTHAVHFTGSLF